uniref:Transmembrane protein 186 n=1 Tax=Globodera pallida TaxID=36090 RepID=A0A183BJK1_GLOPA
MALIVRVSAQNISKKFRHFPLLPLSSIRCALQIPCCSSVVVRFVSVGTQKWHQSTLSVEQQQPPTDAQNELAPKVPTETPSDESEGAELVEWTTDELALKEKAIADNSWTPIYRYGGFVGVWFVLRLNLAFCALSFLSLPMAMSEQWPIAPSIGLIILSLAVCAGVKKYFTRIVAVVSVDSASRSIYRIGYPNFFAARRNRFVRVVDVVPLSTNSENVRGIARLSFYDGPKDDFLLLPTVNVQILDKKAAFLLFGSTIKHFDADLPQSPAAPQRKKNAEKMLRIAMEEKKAQQNIEGDQRKIGGAQ